MPRTGIAAVVVFVVLVAVFAVLAVRGSGEPKPTAKLPAAQLVKRAADNRPRTDDVCAELLERDCALRHNLYGGELTSVQENNVYVMLAGWIAPDDPPSKAQANELLDHCREGTP